MIIHEYQAKEFLRQLGLSIPPGQLAASPAEARNIAASLSTPVIIKAQVLAGGRGKAGGILKARTAAEAESLTRNLLGSKLITVQTGNRGLTVRKVLVEKVIDLKRELYLGLAVDRKNETLVAMVSPQGGLEIEELSRSRPDLIKKIVFWPDEGLRLYQARHLAYFLGLEEAVAKRLTQNLKQLSHFFIDNDLKLLEINPLALTEDNQLVALDARMEFDDYGLARHPELVSLEDTYDESQPEKEARIYRLNYLRLDGQIGCLVNGAGLAMATMDLIQHFGGQPANFLDIGGGVTEEAVSKAFEILISDERVVSALINIFGGIVRCDLVARGVVSQARKLSLKKPVVVRLEGTNVVEGKKILEKSGMPFHFSPDFERAARLAVSLAGIKQ
ncbi:MAG: ADP-forming succinate--CoA ligase subunit beta [Candidatus Saccharicenans sp.]|uniref:ADP-forming succinate--CoA ligase subunit beta n=1 Tax=Candidatus Saccharicenans sp. TaxID=2819258 RepID=UPI00404B79A0